MSLNAYYFQCRKNMTRSRSLGLLLEYGEVELRTEHILILTLRFLLSP